MYTILFSTGNTEKFEIALAACEPLGVTLEQSTLDIDEIQGEDSELIIRDKAQKAFQALGKPVIVSDDSWNIPGLGGFPGAYMKSMDHWFATEDFLNLTSPLEDRRIILVQLLAYQDENYQQVFRREYTATLLKEGRGEYGKPAQKIIAMPMDDGLSISEVYDRGLAHDKRDVAASWQELIAWYKENVA